MHKKAIIRKRQVGASTVRKITSQVRSAKGGQRSKSEAGSAELARINQIAKRLERDSEPLNPRGRGRNPLNRRRLEHF